MFLSRIKYWSFCQTKWYEELHPSSKAWSLLWLLPNYIWIDLSLTYFSHQNAIGYSFFVVEISLLLQLQYKNKNLFHRACLSPQDLFFYLCFPFFFPQTYWRVYSQVLSMQQHCLTQLCLLTCSKLTQVKTWYITYYLFLSNFNFKVRFLP